MPKGKSKTSKASKAKVEARNKEIRFYFILFLIVAVAPVLYILFFSAQVLDFVRDNTPREIQAYMTSEECMEASEMECQMVVTDQGDEYWIAPDGK